MKSIFKYSICLVVALLLLTTCKKKTVDNVAGSLSVTTISVTDITSNSAKCSGKVSFTGNYTVGNCGSCWSESPSPTVNNYFTTDIQGQGQYISKLNNLNPNTHYYVRAYATTSSGIMYGEELDFYTESAGGGSQGGLPTVLLDKVFDIHGHTAKCNAEVTNDGGSDVTTRGVCWSVSNNPMVYNYHGTNGSGIGAYSVELNDLEPGTKYYVRAYANNSNGTVYSEQELTFTTISQPQVTTSEVTNISKTSATGNGVVTDNGGANIVRGFCWSTSNSPEPTILDSCVIATGSAIGTYSASLTNLSPNTTYYVRAFATNEVETTYGNMVTFKTKQYGESINDFLGVYTVTAFDEDAQQAKTWTGTQISTFTNTITNTTWVKVVGLSEGSGYSCFTALGEFCEEHCCIRLYSGWGFLGSDYQFYFTDDPDILYYARFYPIYQTTTTSTWYYLNLGAGYDNTGEAWLTIGSDGRLSLGPSEYPDDYGRFANGFVFDYYLADKNSLSGRFDRYTHVKLRKISETSSDDIQQSMDINNVKHDIHIYNNLFDENRSEKTIPYKY